MAKNLNMVSLKDTGGLTTEKKTRKENLPDLTTSFANALTSGENTLAKKSTSDSAVVNAAKSIVRHAASKTPTMQSKTTPQPIEKKSNPVNNWMAYTGGQTAARGFEDVGSSVQSVADLVNALQIETPSMQGRAQKAKTNKVRNAYTEFNSNGDEPVPQNQQEHEGVKENLLRLGGAEPVKQITEWKDPMQPWNDVIGSASQKVSSVADFIIGRAEEEEKATKAYGEQLSPAGKFVGDVAANAIVNTLRNNVAGLAGTALGSTAVTRAISDAMMFSGSYQSSLKQARQRGLSEDVAQASSIARGLLEVLSEQSSDLFQQTGAVTSLDQQILKGLSKAKMTDFQKYMAFMAIGSGLEGFEEIVSSVGNAGIDLLSYGETDTTGKDVALSFLAGMMSTLMMAGTGANMSQEDFKAEMALAAQTLPNGVLEQTIEEAARQYNIDPDVARSNYASALEASLKGVDEETRAKIIDRLTYGAKPLDTTIKGQPLYEFLGEKTPDMEATLKLADKLGKKVSIAENINGANGVTLFDSTGDGNNIILSAKAKKPLMGFFKHEFSHDLEEQAPDLYEQLKDYSLEHMQTHMGEEYAAWFEDELAKYADVYTELEMPAKPNENADPITYAEQQEEWNAYIEQAEELYETDPIFRQKMDGEIVGRYMEELPNNEQAARELNSRLGNVFQRMWQGFRDTTRQIGGRLTQDERDLLKGEQLFAKVAREAAVRQEKANNIIRRDGYNFLGIDGTLYTDYAYSLDYSTAGANLANVNREQLIQQISEASNGAISEEEARRFVEDEEVMAISIKDTALDFEADPGEVAIKTNSEYPQGTVDLNNNCTKRRSITFMTNRMQEALPQDLFTADDYADIRLIMMDDGRVVACGLCFVEDRRKQLGEIAQTFRDEWANSEDGYLWRTNSSGNRVKVSIGKDLAKRYGVKSGLVTVNDLNMRQVDFGSSDAWHSFQQEHPYEAAAFEAFNNARGQNAGRLLVPRAEYKREILSWSPSKVATVNALGGLRIFSFSDFEAIHMLDIVQIIEDCAAKGVMIQGYTKQPDFAKLVRDTGIKLNRSLIPYGVSGVQTVNGKTVLVFNLKEGMDITSEDFLDETDNPNVGNNITGINDIQIHAAMEDGFIHYIIPFHTGKSNAANNRLGVGKWKNYKNYQTDWILDASNTRQVAALTSQLKAQGMSDSDAFDKALSTLKLKPKSVSANINIYTDVLSDPSVTDVESFQNKFFEVCYEKGMMPRFAQFLNTDTYGNYVYTPGYEKFLVDFKLFDRDGNLLPQEIVRPVFDREFMQDIINRDLAKTEEERQGADYPQELYEKALNYIKAKHGYADADYAAYEELKAKIDSNVEQLNSDENTIQPYALSPSATDARYSLSDEEYDQQYFDALDRGDMDEAQRLRLAHAAENGYTDRAYHGTQAFGFTEPDVSYSDDGKSFFVTDDRDVAKTYAGTDVVKPISGNNGTWLDNEIHNTEEQIDASVNDFIDALNQVAGNTNWHPDVSQLNSDLWTIASNYVDNTAVNANTSLSKDIDDELFHWIGKAWQEGNPGENNMMPWLMSSESDYVSEAEDKVIDRFGRFINLINGTDTNRGIYDLVINPDNLLEHDAKGKKWNDLDIINEQGGRTKETTRSLADYAQGEGYNGYVLNNVFDDGGFGATRQQNPATVYDLFDPGSQVKSADTITYDDNGNIIPLSQRDNPDNPDIRYSLMPVDPIQPSSSEWKRDHTTDEVKAMYPDLWDVAAEESETRNPTQVTSTIKSYKKIYDYLRNTGFNGTILDASSGLGLGTELGRNEYGFDVDDIEPYPGANYTPRYTDYSSLNKTYDAIISNAVLNVLPQDQRDALVVKMGQMLNPGGKMFINVRGKDVLNASSKKVIDPDNMEIYVSNTGSYQKGFTPKELRAYLQDALGSEYTVEPTRMLNGVAAIVTKNAAPENAVNNMLLSLSDDYMDAVNRGDMETAQRLVDQRAREQGYNPEDPWYHGTNAVFNTFNLGKEGIHVGNTDQASQVAKERTKSQPVYQYKSLTDAFNEFDLTDYRIQLWIKSELRDLNKNLRPAISWKKFNNMMSQGIEGMKAVADELDRRYVEQRGERQKIRMPLENMPEGRVLPLYTNNTNPFYINDDVGQWTTRTIADLLRRRANGFDTMPRGIASPKTLDISGSDISLNDDEREKLFEIYMGSPRGDEAWAALDNLLGEHGYTGIEYLNKYEGDKNSPSRLVMNPADVKLSNAVTYDDQGNVIPLDQRFNPDNPDIRYSLADGTEENAVYIPDGRYADGTSISFIDEILDGNKKGETRTHKSLTRKWVGLAKNGQVYGRVRFGNPYLINKNSPEYRNSMIAGTNYDLADGESKYYYPVLETEDFRDNPRPIIRNGNYGQYRYALNEDIPEQANAFPDRNYPQDRGAMRMLGQMSRDRVAADPLTYESISPESFPVPDRIQDYIDLMEDEEDRKYGFDEAPEKELSDEDRDMYKSIAGNKSGALQGFATPTQMFNNMMGKTGEQREFFRDRYERPMFDTKKEYNANREQRWQALENMIKETGIEANTPESAAVQWYGEKAKPNEAGETIPYTLADLKKEFPNKWQDIVKMERFMRGMYDEYVGRINAALEQVYPNLEEKAQAQLESWRNKKRIYQDEIEMSRSPVANEYWEGEIAKLDKKIAKLEGDLESGEYFRNKRLNPRKDYFHHFQEVETKGIGGLKNILQASTLIDPELVGKSANTKPKSRWMSWLQRRGQGAYTADAVLGMGKYIDSAEYAIAFDPLIAQYRDEISKMVKATRDTKNANQLIQYLSSYTNQLAGKTASLDRTILDLLGEGNRGQLFNVLSSLNNRAKSNAVVGNIRSAVAQIFNIPNAMSIIKSNSAWGKGVQDYISAKLGNRELLDQSPFLQERYFKHNVDDLKARNTNWEKITGKLGDVTNAVMELGDREATELIWLAAYNEGKDKGVSDPVYYADDLTRQSVAGRGIGEVPYNMKSKVASFFMPFQVETNNAWQNMKGMLRDKDGRGIFRLMLGSFLMNAMVKPLFNDGVVPDILSVILEGIKKLFDKDREESAGEVALDTAKRMAGEAVSYIPGTSLWLPAIMSSETAEDLFGESDPTRYGTGTVGLSTITKTLADAVNGDGFDLMTPLLQLGLPYGGRQASRLYNTLQDFNVLPSNGVMNTPFGGEKTPATGDYSKAGALKYRLPDEVNSGEDLAEILRAFAFGSNATNAAAEYFETGKPALSKERVEKLRENPEVNADTYIDYLREANTDGKAGISQAEAYKWLSQQDLTDEEKNALWNMTSSSWTKSYDEYTPQNETLVNEADADGNGRVTQAEAYDWLSKQDIPVEEKEAMWAENGWKKSYKEYSNNLPSGTDSDDEQTEVQQSSATTSTTTKRRTGLDELLSKSTTSPVKTGSNLDQIKTGSSGITNRKELLIAADSNNDGYMSQKEAYAYLSNSNLSDEEKNALWNLSNWKTSYDGYAKKHGA